MYDAAACQTAFDCPRTRAELRERTRRMCEIVENAIVGYEPFFDVRDLRLSELVLPASIAGGPDHPKGNRASNR